MTNNPLVIPKFTPNQRQQLKNFGLNKIRKPKTKKNERPTYDIRVSTCDICKCRYESAIHNSEILDKIVREEKDISKIDNTCVICRLEKTLPFNLISLSQPPKLSEVSDILEDISKALKSFEELISKLLDPNLRKQTRERQDALQRVKIASDWDNTIEVTFEAVKKAILILPRFHRHLVIEDNIL